MMTKCISREKGIQFLWDIHSGICRSHSSWRPSSGKPLDMVSTGLQPRMTRWRLSPNAGIASFFSEVNYEVYKSSSTYRSLLAFHNLGNQYCGCFTQGTSWIQIFIRRHRYVTKWLEAMRVVNIM
jgi:hypothetical protein